MTPHQQAQEARQSRLRSLLKSWTMTTQKKEKLQRKAAPSLLEKLSAWVEQIALLQHKENDIISEITSVEKKHEMMRKSKKLRRATPKKEEVLDPPEEEPKDRFWLWFMLIVLFFRNNKKPESPKNG